MTESQIWSCSHMPLGVFLPDADGQAHAGLKACHINQVQSL